MKSKRIWKTVGLIFLIVVLALAAEFIVSYMINSTKAPSPENEVKQADKIERYQDVRRFNSDGLTDKDDISQCDFSKQKDFEKILPFVRFNEFTVWPSKEKMPKNANPQALLDAAKEVGLGYSKAHELGFTGKGVNIGIIDQNIYRDNPEYAQAIKDYRNFGDTDIDGSFMSTALVSLVAGKTTGVAPDVGIYYAAVAIEQMDVQFYRDAMLWYEELNQQLPVSEKIHIVMIPATIHGGESSFEENTEMWDEIVQIAQRSGITIVDCSAGRKFGSCWRDVNDPDNFDKVQMGYPDDGIADSNEHLVLFPVSQKTVAEEYVQGKYGFQYMPKSAISWSLAVAVGTMTLGAQCIGDNYSLYSVDWLFEKMYSTAQIRVNKAENADGDRCRIIDVNAFCKECTKYDKN